VPHIVLTSLSFLFIQHYWLSAYYTPGMKMQWRTKGKTTPLIDPGFLARKRVGRGWKNRQPNKSGSVSQKQMPLPYFGHLQPSSLSHLPPYRTAFLWSSKFSPSPTGRGGWSCNMAALCTLHSVFLQCLLSSRIHGLCQWLGKAVLTKVSRDTHGGRVQFISYRQWHFDPALCPPAPHCPLRDVEA
jgi:hypothetical protein